MGTTTDDDDATDDGRSAMVGRSTTDAKQKIRKRECYHNCVFLWHYSGVNLCYYNQHTLHSCCVTNPATLCEHIMTSFACNSCSHIIALLLVWVPILLIFVYLCSVAKPRKRLARASFMCCVMCLRAPPSNKLITRGS